MTSRECRFPILKPTSTVLGRGGTDQSGAPRQVDVPLLNDKLVSGRHAEIRRANDHFVLEDLKSKNGTFVQYSRENPGWRWSHDLPRKGLSPSRADQVVSGSLTDRPGRQIACEQARPDAIAASSALAAA